MNYLWFQKLAFNSSSEPHYDHDFIFRFSSFYYYYFFLIIYLFVYIFQLQVFCFNNFHVSSDKETMFTRLWSAGTALIPATRNFKILNAQYCSAGSLFQFIYACAFEILNITIRVVPVGHERVKKIEMLFFNSDKKLFYLFNYFYFGIQLQVSTHTHKAKTHRHLTWYYIFFRVLISKTKKKKLKKHKKKRKVIKELYHSVHIIVTSVKDLE